MSIYRKVSRAHFCTSDDPKQRGAEIKIVARTVGEVSEISVDHTTSASFRYEFEWNENGRCRECLVMPAIWIRRLKCETGHSSGPTYALVWTQCCCRFAFIWLMVCSCLRRREIRLQTIVPCVQHDASLPSIVLYTRCCCHATAPFFPCFILPPPPLPPMTPTLLLLLLLLLPMPSTFFVYSLCAIYLMWCRRRRRCRMQLLCICAATERERHGCRLQSVIYMCTFR